MPIKSVLGKYSGQFQKRTKGPGTIDVTAILRQASIERESRQVRGKDTVDGLLAAINYLRPFVGEQRVELRLLELNNGIAIVENRQRQGQLGVGTVRAKLQESLNVVSQLFGNDPRALMQKTADVYNTIFDLYVEETLPLIQENFELGDAASVEAVSFGNELQDKANAHSEIVNSFNQPIEGRIGPQDPEAFGYYVQTNPSTGTVISVLFESVDSLNPKKAGFSKTDSFAQVNGVDIPIYLNWFGRGNKRIARLGNREFEANRDQDAKDSDEFGLIVLEQQRVGLRFGRFGASELVVDLNVVSHSPLDIPRNNVIRDSFGSLSYVNNDGQIRLVESENALRRLLDEIPGNDPDEMIDGAYIASRTYVRSRAQFLGGEPITDDMFAPIEGIPGVIVPGGVPQVDGAPFIGPQPAPVVEPAVPPVGEPEAPPLQPDIIRAGAREVAGEARLLATERTAETIERTTREVVSGARRLFERVTR